MNERPNCSKLDTYNFALLKVNESTCSNFQVAGNSTASFHSNYSYLMVMAYLEGAVVCGFDSNENDSLDSEDTYLFYNDSSPLTSVNNR